ncbi:hypothetical protein C2W62_31145 [Candidatus Entotheonella serta]|nr:hypothetical protein C2W62_31145 [Candidatus Entotheonella serta]
MTKKFITIELLVFLACLLSAVATTWAQDKECRSDARTEYRECKDENGCQALRVQAREICEAQGRSSDACQDAREDARDCKKACRSNFRDASKECRDDYKTCRSTCNL